MSMVTRPITLTITITGEDVESAIDYLRDDEGYWFGYQHIKVADPALLLQQIESAVKTPRNEFYRTPVDGMIESIIISLWEDKSPAFEPD